MCVGLPALAAIIFAHFLPVGKISENWKGQKKSILFQRKLKSWEKTLEQVSKSHFETSARW